MFKHTFIGLFISISCFSQSQELANLFYCNQSENISKLWLTNDGNALGVRMKDKPDWHIQDLVLINKNRLIVDSVSLNHLFNIDEGRYISIKQLFKTSNDQFYLVHSFGTSIIQVADDQIKLLNQKIKLEKLDEKIKLLYPNIYRESIFSTDKCLIGYHRDNFKSKKKSKFSKNDSKNTPNFWIVDFDRAQKFYDINHENSVDYKTKDLFIDVSDFDYVNDRTNVFSSYVTITENKIYFNVTRANKCYIFDKKTKKISFFTFPNLDSAESFFFYHDYILDRNFLIKKTKEAFQVFLLSMDYKTIKHLKDLIQFPVEVINGQVHYTRIQKENGRKFKCHYLMPLFREGEKIKLLEEINIQDD